MNFTYLYKVVVPPTLKCVPNIFQAYLNDEVLEEFPPVNTGCNLAPGMVSRLEVSLSCKTCLSQNQQRFLGAPVKWPRPNILSAWLDVTPGFESTS